MKHTIDIESWKRKAHYLFFKEFEEPFYGLCVNVDVTKAYRHCKKNDVSFFLYHLYQSIKAVNQVPALKLRMEDESVVEYDVIHPSTTILRADNTFGFAYFEYKSTFDEFAELASKEVKRVKTTKGLDWSKDNPDTVHYSSVPWVQFTSLSHARSFSHKGSTPKITFGKVFEQGELLLMPTSIHVHHALVDGIDVGSYIDWFQDCLNE